MVVVCVTVVVETGVAVVVWAVVVAVSGVEVVVVLWAVVKVIGFDLVWESVFVFVVVVISVVINVVSVGVGVGVDVVNDSLIPDGWLTEPYLISK